MRALCEVFSFYRGAPSIRLPPKKGLDKPFCLSYSIIGTGSISNGQDILLRDQPIWGVARSRPRR